MVPEAISHYQLIRKLGGGGMGEVYLAEDTKLNRQVAIKFLPPDSVSNDNANRRLIQEAQAAARLDHPNICTVYEVAELEGRCFIVMQYVEGDTLASRMKAGTLSIEETLDVALQISDALCEAHSQGIVHRDIKPHNIMITPKGVVKVLDFGLAKFFQQDVLSNSHAETASMLTAPGMIVGTLPYMSPEQVKGEPIDGRSDIFSFGAVLYELVTGKQPFWGDTAATTLAYIIMKDPPSLSEFVPQVPPQLQRVVSKALAKSKEQRYQTAKELLSDLIEISRQIPREGEVTSYWSSAFRRGKAATLDLLHPSTDSQEVIRTTRTYRVNALLAGRRALVVFGVLSLTIASLVLVLIFSKGNIIDSIAVLPFIDINSDPEMEYLSDGISESLMNRLSQLPNLKVIARSSVARYKGQEIDPQTIGRALKVGSIITGKIAQRGDNLTINVELVDTRDNTRIWGETFARKASDIQALQIDISRQISDRLRLKLSGQDNARLGKRQTDNAEAYRYYLQGRYYWNKLRGGVLRKAIEYFQKALDIDPNYALAHAGIAESWVLGGGVSIPPSEYMLKAKAAAENALRLDDALVEAHTTLARVKSEYEWDWKGAEAGYKHAIELNPNYATAYEWYAEHLAAMGRLDESSAMLKRAYELDPLSMSINTALGKPHLYAERYDQAVAAFKQALEIDPSFVEAHYWLGIAYERQGRHDQAIAEFQQELSVAKGFFPALAMVGYCHAKARRRAEAENVLKQLVEISKTRHISTENMAMIFTGLGENEQAIDWLWKAYEARAGFLIYLKVDPVFADLRSHPRFQQLVQQMDLP